MYRFVHNTLITVQDWQLILYSTVPQNYFFLEDLYLKYRNKCLLRRLFFFFFQKLVKREKTVLWIV